MKKNARVRFYFDEDILRLAHTVARLRPDCTFPGDSGDEIHKKLRPPSPVARGAKDTDWVPVVANLGWLIFTRDFNIRENPAERRAVRENGAKMVALSGADATNTWGQLGLLLKYWPRFEDLVEQPGPFIYLASRSRLRLLEISD